MAFELDTFTEATLVNHETLSDKDRDPGENPGVSLHLEIVVSNQLLSQFDGHMLHMLYTKSAASAPAQPTLDGIPAITNLPNLSGIGKAIKGLKLKTEYTGMQLVIDYGMGEASNLLFENAKASRFSIDPKEGGSVEIKFVVEAPDVPEVTHGKVPKLKCTKIKIQLVQVAAAQGDLVGEQSGSVPLGGEESDDNGNPFPHDLDPKDKQPENPFEPLTPAQALANSVGIGDQVSPTTQVTVKRGRRAAGPAAGAPLQ